MLSLRNTLNKVAKADVVFCVFLPVVRRYPIFLGRAHRSAPRQELHIQTVLQVNRTLYIGAR